MNRTLVILLHGVGGNGANMAPLGHALSSTVAGVTFNSPDAPQTMGGGRAWFSVAGITEANRSERVLAAREDFDTIISGLIAENGLASSLDRVAFLGFSQGAIMALDALASGRWPIGGVIAFSGRLASPAPITPSLQTRLLLVHGDSDHVMPPGETLRAGEIFRAAGVATSVVIEPGLGHQISSAGLAQASRFIEETFPQS